MSSTVFQRQGRGVPPIAVSLESVQLVQHMLQGDSSCGAGGDSATNPHFLSWLWMPERVLYGITDSLRPSKSVETWCWPSGPRTSSMTPAGATSAMSIILSTLVVVSNVTPYFLGALLQVYYTRTRTRRQIVDLPG